MSTVDLNKLGDGDRRTIYVDTEVYTSDGVDAIIHIDRVRWWDNLEDHFSWVFKREIIVNSFDWKGFLKINIMNKFWYFYAFRNKKVKINNCIMKFVQNLVSYMQTTSTNTNWKLASYMGLVVLTLRHQVKPLLVMAVSLLVLCLNLLARGQGTGSCIELK